MALIFSHFQTPRRYSALVGKGLFSLQRRTGSHFECAPLSAKKMNFYAPESI